MSPERAKKKAKGEPIDPMFARYRNDCRERWPKVHIEDHSGHGRVIIEYARLEDFDGCWSNWLGINTGNSCPSMEQVDATFQPVPCQILPESYPLLLF